ncbi:energy transducer TonB [Nitrospirillum amazonense]|uniref:energy transducer TonB n=1 Tax=Nitrospirillum amazonense TaxID=28077 RepID=UPI0011A39C5A
MRTSAGHAVLSGMMVVLALWPFSPSPSRAQAAERVFLPVIPPFMVIDFEYATPTTFQPPLRPLTRIDPESFRRFPPTYPAAAIKRSEEGRVVFIAFCNAKGRVYNARVVESSTHDQLDAALVKAARSRRWRCTPAVENGQAVPSATVKLAYRFRLPDDGKSQHR